MRSHKPIIQPSRAVYGVAVFVALSVGLSAHSVRGGEKPVGEQVYLSRCASCHGTRGEGTKNYQKPLIGKRSVAELARFITQSMPPGPKKCPAPDAQKVAAYIYDAFYSPIAQARNKPPRVELSRLTVRQYRNAVADLIGSFRPAAPAWGDARGLHGDYFKQRRFSSFDRALERVDPEISFNWGAAGAIPAQDDPYQFAMRWEGSVIAPSTGEYDFIVKSDQAIRLWVNDMRTPLIDVTVQSGSDTEFHAPLVLLAGRPYPLRLEFSKGVTGVNNLMKLKAKPPQNASLSLEWKPPHQATSVIPRNYLLPVMMPEGFSVAAPFPPDDRSIGYERGTSVSKAWEEATTEAAIETAGYVVKRLSDLAGVADNASDRDAKLRAFCRQFAERAFRRPFTDELVKLYIERPFQGAPDLDTAVKRSLMLVLKSPRFLYREMGQGKADPYDVASRLSFGLWDSLPDETLLKAAAAGELATREQVAKQAERMLADPRTRSKVREFFWQWLRVDQFPDLAKDTKRFPGFDDHAASDLRISLELFLDSVIWSDKSDFRDLLMSDKVFLNGRLAKLYGVNLPADAPFEPVPLDSLERAGVLTQPYVMASFAYVDTTSPIHRGVLIARNMLGRMLRPPPEAFTPLPAEKHPKLTTRQRVALQTQPAACQGCHGMINPLGFSLERFDAIGKLRNRENGLAIDVAGSYQGRDGKPNKFFGARGLGRFLAGSEEAHSAFVEKLFQNMVKQPVRAYGTNALPSLEQSFAANEFSIRKQLVEIMAASALGAMRPVDEPRAAPTPRPAATGSSGPGRRASGLAR